MLVPLLIFLGTYLGLAIGGLPGFRIDRTGAALIGASLMLASGTLTLDEAWQAIHYETLFLLLGMMIVVAGLRLSGFFTVVAAWVVDHAHQPLTLLTSIVLVSGVFSAFFVNDTMCLVLTPLVLEITTKLERNPIPYLLAVAMGRPTPTVLVFRPFVEHLPDQAKAWLVLAMSSTLAGNLTILGSVANLIVIEHSRREVKIGFWEYARAGIPVAILSIAVGVLLLS